MTARLIDGKAVAARVRHQTGDAVAARLAQGKRPPTLATVLVGADPASEIYVRSKRRTCEELGIRSAPVHMDASTSLPQLLGEIDRLNDDAGVDGILVQLPLPAHLDVNAVVGRIRPDKDVDGFHPYNFGRLAQRSPVLRPCTPLGVMKLLQATDVMLRGAHAVVIGASNIVGRPMALELMLADATVTICNSKTRNLAGLVAQADIVVAGVGIPRIVKGAWIKPGATVIDVGINRLPDGSLVGDVEFDAARSRAAWITPVPGGVGPMTIAMLMENTLRAAQAREPAQG